MKKNKKKKKKNNKGFGAYEFLTVAVVCLVLTAILLVAILKLSNKEKYQVFNFNARVMAMNAINYNFKDEGTIYLYEMLKLDLISPIKNPFNGKNCDLYESKVEFLKEGKKVTLKCGEYLIDRELVGNKSYTLYRVTDWNDDKEYEAEIIGTDEQTDLAVIKINKNGLTAAELGSSSSVKVGEFCMAIGNPLGLGSTVTDGIVSAVNREVTDEDGNSYIAIQTNAAINSGNSGGALVNSQGQVIGINTLKISGNGVEGVGFAIPIDSTKDIYEQLIQYNKVKRPYLGIGGIEVDAETAESNDLVEGIYVKTLDNFSAAEKAGIKVGDVITKADGKEIKTMDELNAIKNAKQIGDEITLTIWRNGDTQDIKVKLQEQP